MRRHFVLATLFAVAACGHQAHEETQTSVTRDGVTTTTVTKRDAGAAGAPISGLNIDSDKFKANIEIPGLTFGGDHLDMDGMKLYPGSKVTGVRVHAVDRPANNTGEVAMTFASPAAPAVVARHMADQARQAGFTVASASDTLVSGSKVDGDKNNRFSVTLNPNSDGTVGVMTLTDIKK